MKSRPSRFRRVQSYTISVRMRLVTQFRRVKEIIVTNLNCIYNINSGVLLEIQVEKCRAENASVHGLFKGE